MTSVSLESAKDIPFPTVTVCGNQASQKWTIVGRMLRHYDPEAKLILKLFRTDAELSRKLGELNINMGQFYYWSLKALRVTEKYKKMDVSQELELGLFLTYEYLLRTHFF